MRFSLFHGVALFALAMPAGAMAQDAPQSSEAADLGEIVVTANRIEQRALDVAAPVLAVTAEDLSDLKIFRAEDIENLSPGLEMYRPLGSMLPTVTLRGLNTTASQSQQPGADFFINEVWQNMAQFLVGLYDVGQIEVLRGPQGFVRGRSTPSGSVTMTTKRPDLYDFGGYAEFTGTSRNGLNVQAGVSVPLVPGKLAVRVAGLIDESDGNQVRSVNGGPDPYANVKSGRVTVLAQPLEILEIVAMYQHLRQESSTYTQVFGPGNGFNGPALAARDRRAVGTQPSTLDLWSNVVTLNAALELPIGASLIYTGGYQDDHQATFDFRNSLNTILDDDRIAFTGGPVTTWTHELRLQSNGGGMVDYVLGAYSQDYKSTTDFQSFTALPGYAGVDPGYPDADNPLASQYELFINGNISNHIRQKALYGNVSVRPIERLEITGGLRWVDIKAAALTTRPAASARSIAGTPASLGFPTLSCTTLRLQPSNLATPTAPLCDALVTQPASSVPGPPGGSAVVWKGSIRYSIDDDVNIYASVGKSFRSGNTNAQINDQGLPALLKFAALPNETAINYEVGFKGQFLDRTVRLSLAAFQQDFKNLGAQITGVPYLNSTQISSQTFSVVGDARIRGIEAELFVRPYENFNISVSGAYTKSNFKNALLPCRDGNGDGVEDSLRPVSGVPGRQDENRGAGSTANAIVPGALTLANPIALCVNNRDVNDSPRFAGNLQAELRAPLGESEAYLRTLINYRTKVTNRSSAYTTPAYETVNLFAGVRIGDSADISVFARNLFDKHVITARAALVSAGYSPGGGTGLTTFSTGYRTVELIAPREIGLSFRKSWGGR